MESLDKPYCTLLLDVVGGAFVSAPPPLLVEASPLLSVELGAGESHLVRALRFQEVDGLFFTRRWLAEPMGPELRALLALRSLSLPMFLLEEPGDPAPPGPPDPLLALMEPLPLDYLHRGGAASRLMTSLMAARHRLRWLSRLDFDRPRQRILEQLSDVQVDPSTGVTSPEFFSDRIAYALSGAQSEGLGASCMLAELRWPQGSAATLSTQALKVLDQALRSCLRETDLVGKVAPGVYLIFLPGQGPEQALIPARRLAKMGWSQLQPEFHPGLTLGVGLSGRDEPPTDGLALIMEADLAMGRASGDVPEVYHPGMEPALPTPPIDRALLEGRRAQLRGALPGLFPAPFSDRAFLRHIAAALPPGRPLPDPGRYPRVGDALAVAMGFPLGLRRSLWRACLCAETLTHLLEPAAQDARSGRPPGLEPHFLSRPVIDLMMAVPGLGPELGVMQEVRRRLRGRIHGEARKGGDQGRVARVLEVVESYMGLRALGPELGLWEIEESLLGGRNWRYDPEVVETFVAWLRTHREAEGL